MNHNGILVLFGTNGKAPDTSINGMDIDYIVERNITVMGSVDGSRIHYEKALQDISRWKHQYGSALDDMITSRVSPEQTDIFLHKSSGEIKTVIDWS
jgi:glucose/galactose 1-dehydrogenase (NADP+)